MFDASPADGALHDPTHDAQRHFRALLSAMAEPGREQRIDGPIPPEGIPGPALWGMLLSLADLDTAIWIDQRISTDALWRTLAFLTGATLTEAPEAADFAVVLPDTPIERLPFRHGEPDWPERSTTLLVVADVLDCAQAEHGWRLSGPGIAGERHLTLDPPGLSKNSDTLLGALAATRQHFPLGLDAVLACHDRLVALPRSTRLTRARPQEPNREVA
ncbi:phosphonate C-P lyase system protein PhnH [Kushneria phosphatilytica]|uniref:Phosphonate C-P lyase system protein PhnH n=1 Tax=Kushneria phosphatilytica TaxID=657387 RepID=A0A1S1NUS7_9GAMM|nr:phosphonate C-P lyase system protein PhnH [Kushneria phosphatilytica]OHV08636.1 phosphonate C-P lyase system protein PhnH [Kushneria phosphatilytica]QEL12344.1 phosphonate C-P lyase system protein PhnH [Kushneria phosphatilytica]